MRLRWLAVVGLGAVLFGGTAPEVWNTKDFASWTEKDAQSIMNSSPWVKERPMPISGRPDVVVLDPNVSASSVPTASLGNPANASSGTNMSSTGAGSTPVSAGRSDQTVSPQTNSLSSPSAGAPHVQPVLKVIWASALPVRLAVLKLRSGKMEVPADQLAKTKQDWKNYVIAVVNLPAPESGLDPKALAGSAFLTLHGKAPQAASESSYRRMNDSDVYFFSFSKPETPITAAEGEVEFKLTTKQVNLRQKFQLSAMNYQGKLAL